MCLRGKKWPTADGRAFILGFSCNRGFEKLVSPGESDGLIEARCVRSLSYLGVADTTLESIENVGALQGTERKEGE